MSSSQDFGRHQVNIRDGDAGLISTNPPVRMGAFVARIAVILLCIFMFGLCFPVYAWIETVHQTNLFHHGIATQGEVERVYESTSGHTFQHRIAYHFEATKQETGQIYIVRGDDNVSYEEYLEYKHADPTRTIPIIYDAKDIFIHRQYIHGLQSTTDLYLRNLGVDGILALSICLIAIILIALFAFSAASQRLAAQSLRVSDIGG